MSVKDHVVGAPDPVVGAPEPDVEDQSVAFLRTDLFEQSPGETKQTVMYYRAFDLVKWLNVVESKNIDIQAIVLERSVDGTILPNIVVVGDATRSDHFEETGDVQAD